MPQEPLEVSSTLSNNVNTVMLVIGFQAANGKWKRVNVMFTYPNNFEYDGPAKKHYVVNELNGTTQEENREGRN